MQNTKQTATQKNAVSFIGFLTSNLIAFINAVRYLIMIAFHKLNCTLIQV